MKQKLLEYSSLIENVYNHTISNKISIKDGESACGLYSGFCRRYMAVIENYAIKNSDQELIKIYENLTELRKIAKNINSNEIQYSDEYENNTVGNNVEEYDSENGTTNLVRDSEGKIVLYEFSISFKDGRELNGSFTRSEMETIYSHYPYITRNNLAGHFLSYTVEELKKILYFFGITKDKKFPPHIVEEKSPEEISEFAIRAKERIANTIFGYEEIAFYKSKYKELSAKIYNYEKNEKRILDLVEKILEKQNTKKVQFNPVFDNKKIKTKNIYTILSDFHFGKYFDGALYGRGNSKEILSERIEFITNRLLLESEYSENIEIFVLGDIFESVMVNGMHDQHVEEMDILREEQIIFALEIFEKMLDLLCENYKNVKVHIIGGNHDRILPQRNSDIGRTATKLLFKLLEKNYKKTDNIKIMMPENNIIQSFNNEDGISFIGFHGDNSLLKQQPTNIINLFKKGDSSNYTVIMNGHLHTFKIREESFNYISMQVSSICSVDDYVQNQLGKTSPPSFIIGRCNIPKHFDFEKINLW